MIKTVSIFPLGAGKVFGAYILLGCCWSLVFVGSLAGASTFQSSDIIFLVLSLGSMIGSILSTFDLHRPAKFFYGFGTGSLKDVFTNDFQKFDANRDNFYFRFILLITGGSLLLFGEKSIRTLSSALYK
ncbi:MAG: hypothetical protein ACFFD4_40620, partial [Candidatus Odinarchaeota archaeon]